jgi:hypothetical protein
MQKYYPPYKLPLTPKETYHMLNNNSKTQPIIQIVINCMPDNSTSVTGVPLNLLHALDILATTQKIVLSHFLNQTKKGNIDDNLSIIPSTVTTQKEKPVDPNEKLTI